MTTSAFVSSFERRAARLRYEGEAKGGSDARVVRGEQQEARLTVSVSAGDVVVEARHQGAPSPAEAAVLDAVCEAIEGLPLREAVDHGPIRAMHALRDPAARWPVAGIASPLNVDPAFRLPVALLRALRPAAGDTQGYNDYVAPPTAAWQALGKVDKEARISGEIANFCQASAFDRGAVLLAELESDLCGNDVRATVAMDGSVPAAEAPVFTMRLERHLKRTVEPAIQVCLSEVKDQNSLRRL